MNKFCRTFSKFVTKFLQLRCRRTKCFPASFFSPKIIGSSFMQSNVLWLSYRRHDNLVFDEVHSRRYIIIVFVIRVWTDVYEFYCARLCIILHRIQFACVFFNFSFRFTGGDWVNLSYGSAGRWSIGTVVYLATRNDTSQPNSSPITTGKPTYV